MAKSFPIWDHTAQAFPPEITAAAAAATSAQIMTAATSTTAALTAVANLINSSGKFAGKSVYNTTTKKPVWADAATAAGVWVDATGTTAHTPV